MSKKDFRKKRYVSAKDEIFDNNKELALELMRRF